LKKQNSWRLFYAEYTRLDINTDVRYRFAETLYIIKVFNPSDENQTYVADIPFPKEAFVYTYIVTLVTKASLGNGISATYVWF
jgi:hypothetical protein